MPRTRWCRAAPTAPARRSSMRGRLPRCCQQRDDPAAAPPPMRSSVLRPPRAWSGHQSHQSAGRNPARGVSSATHDRPFASIDDVISRDELSLCSKATSGYQVFEGGIAQLRMRKIVPLLAEFTLAYGLRRQADQTRSISGRDDDRFSGSRWRIAHRCRGLHRSAAGRRISDRRTAADLRGGVVSRRF